MEAVTDVVFRHVVAAAAPPDVWFTEFTNATGWAHAGDKAIGGRLIKTEDENPIIAQLWGSDPASMEKLAQHCAKLGYHGIDINMGCPDQSAVKSGGGAGMILTPDNARAIIAAAKTSGLPVSVKTRLGYSKIDEWHDWLTHLLQQDIVNLTIHLRTKKEMSKVPAHFELIPEIKQLRDDIAPQTLLTINGDIRDRQHGVELVEKYGVDGVMIGRGIFHNPFAFSPMSATGGSSTKPEAAHLQGTIKPEETSAARISAGGSTTEIRREAVSEGFDSATVNTHKDKLINLLSLQLDLHDKYNEKMPRKFDPLKRFFKIYVRDFAGASELRDQLMHTKSTQEVREILEKIHDNEK